VLGRFLSADTIVPDPSNPQRLNRFSYTRNNPLKYTDPTGHQDRYDEGGGGSPPQSDFPRFSEVAGPLLVVAVSFFYEPVDYVSTAVQCATTGCSPADVVLTLAPGSLSAINKLADVFRAGENVGDAVKAVENAGDAVEQLTDVGKLDIAAELSKGLPQQQRIAKAINDGEIGVNILEKESFARQARSFGWRSDPEDLKGIAYKDQIYLRKGSTSLYSDAVHEGTHAIDYLDSFKGPKQSWERRAYYYERQYQIYSNRGLDFETLPDMLQHIRKVY
jgi:hypothetical protein